MTTVFIVHGNDYEDQEIRSVHNTYREAVAELEYPILDASWNIDVTISQWTVGVGRVERPTARGYRVTAHRERGQAWNSQVHVGSCEFDAEDDPISHRVKDTCINVWALDKDEAGRLMHRLMQESDDPMGDVGE